jgi:acyl-CoA synthetase (AMP-forming)/AMP-acid ligase II
MGLYDFTFYDAIIRNATIFRERKAWIESIDNRQLTFLDFKEEVDLLARGLQNHGVRKGDRIGILGRNNLEYFLLFGAAAASGAIVVPINWRLSAEEIFNNLNDCGPKLVFVDREFQETIEKLRHALASVKEYFNLGIEHGGFSDFESLMEHNDSFEPEPVSTDDTFIIIHTAAVAGRARGALLSHGNLVCATMHFISLMNLTVHDVHLGILPLFHVGGLFMTAACFHAGSLTVNMRQFNPLMALELIGQMKVSVMLEFPPILSQILDAHERTGMDIGSLRAVGGLDNPETIEKYQCLSGGYFYSSYGQTETSCLASFGRYDNAPGSAGRVLPLVQMRLEDDAGQPVSLGQTGEIAIKGPMVFKGYYNLQEDDKYTFRGGWHHTGDLGRLDEEGFLWYEGRKPEKELIKPGGENVYPVEVEKVILQHPSIEKCVVFGVPDMKWKEAIKAVCQLREKQNVEPQELIEFVGARIARYKRPKYLEFTSDFPMLENGMPDREKIKRMYQSV